MRITTVTVCAGLLRKVGKNGTKFTRINYLTFQTLANAYNLFYYQTHCERPLQLFLAID